MVSGERAGDGLVTVTYRTPTQLAVARARYGLLSVTLSARLTEQNTGQAIAGQTVSFSVNGTVICSATTNATGDASCTAFPALLLTLGPASYTGTYAGNADYFGSTGTGPL